MLAPLINMLTGADEHRRLVALEEVLCTAIPDVLDLIIELLTDALDNEDAVVRRQAKASLAGIRKPPFVVLYRGLEKRRAQRRGRRGIAPGRWERRE
jgi:hypothetical protein